MKRSAVDLDKMNISNELLKTSIWKGITDSNKQVNDSVDGGAKKRGNKDAIGKSSRKSTSNNNEDLDIPLIDQSSTNDNIKRSIVS